MVQVKTNESCSSGKQDMLLITQHSSHQITSVTVVAAANLCEFIVVLVLRGVESISVLGSQPATIFVNAKLLLGFYPNF